MARIKYYYDTETCKYERIKVSSWDVFLNLMGFFAIALILAAGIVLGFYNFFESPKEAQLKKEVEEMELYFSLIEKDIEKMNGEMAYLQEKDDETYRVIFEADPIDANIRKAGVGGADRYKHLLEKGLYRKELIIDTYKKIDELKGRMWVQSRSYDEILEMAAKKTKMLASIPAIQPVANKELKRLASGFGVRYHPIYKVRKMHWGCDFSAPRGTPVYATGDGVISRTQHSRKALGYGNMIKIDHGYGYETLYAHLHKIAVKKGQKVKRGELIGYVGNTGGSTAPHLHYEVVKDGKKVNPVQFFFHDISDEEYQKLLELATVENQSLG